EVVRIHPLSLCSQLLPNSRVERSAGKGIGNGNSDVIGARLADQLDSLLDMFPGLARVAELQEEAGADALALKIFPGYRGLLDARALVHGVEDFLRARLHPHPDLGAPRTFERARGLFGHQIDARLHLERKRRRAPLDRISKLEHPARLDAKKIVREPEVLGAKRIF